MEFCELGTVQEVALGLADRAELDETAPLAFTEVGSVLPDVLNAEARMVMLPQASIAFILHSVIKYLLVLEKSSKAHSCLTSSAVTPDCPLTV